MVKGSLDDFGDLRCKCRPYTRGLYSSLLTFIRYDVYNRIFNHIKDVLYYTQHKRCFLSLAT